MDEAIEEFIQTKKVKRLSYNTIKAYTFYLTKFQRYIKNKDIEDINFADVIGFTENMSVLTARFFIIVLKSFLKFFGRAKLSNRIPLPKGTGKEIRPLNKTEIELLKNKLKNRFDKAVFHLMISSGLRAGEVINLKIKDIDFENNIGKVLGKGKKKYEKPDIFVFNDEAKTHLLNYLGKRIKNKEDYVFLQNKEKITYYRFWKYFKKHFGLRPHQLRHTFCTIYADKLLPTEIQVLARHKSFESTKKYINPELKETIKKYKELKI